MFKPMIASAAIALGVFGWRDAGHAPAPLLLKEEQVYVEYTAGNGETVMVITAESEEPLRSVRVVGPHGIRVFELGTAPQRGLAVQGFEIETSETSAATLFHTYAEGVYELRALTLEGVPAIGRAVLSHALPAPTQVTYPQEGATNVPTTQLTVTWEPEAGAASYQVNLEQNENDGLSVTLPAGSKSFTIPDGLLAPGTRTQLEIGAVGQNGNRTLVEVYFTTQGIGAH